MLKSIVVENYRSCLKTAIDLSPNLSVLIGPNGSGKTNILQAIMLLNKMAEERYIPRPSAEASANPRIGAAFELDRSRARLNASVDVRTDESNNDVVRASQQKWTLKAANGKTASSRMPMAFAGRNQSYLLTIGPGHPVWSEGEAQTWENRLLSRVAEFCKGIRYYSASQFTNPSSCPVSFEIEGSGQEIRRPLRFRGHRKLLSDMYFASKRQSNSTYQQFIDIVGRRGLGLIGDLKFREVPSSSSDHSVRVGGKIERRRHSKLLIVPQFTIGRQRLSPNQLSEGTFKTLALLFHVITSDSTALLVEEPEVCVHHGLLASILELIKSYASQKQMVLSTHSDYVLDHVAPENVFRVVFDRTSGTQVHYIPTSMRSKDLAVLRQYLEKEGNLGEFWREGGLGDRP